MVAAVAYAFQVDLDGWGWIVPALVIGVGAFLGGIYPALRRAVPRHISKSLKALPAARAMMSTRLLSIAIALASIALSAGVAFVFLGQLMPNDYAWSNPEVIYQRDSEPIIGRVVSEREGWLYVVDQDTPSLNVIARDDVMWRSPCVLDSASLDDRVLVSNYFGAVTVWGSDCDEVLALWTEHYKANR